MNNRIALLLAAALCLGLAACSPKTEPKETTQAPQRVETTQSVPEETVPQSVEIVGPWHLDSEKNDLAAFADSIDLFPGFGEWGASMEIRGNGQMSWYIGAEGWHGTYTLENGVIHAQLTSDLEQSEKDWTLPVRVENGKVLLEMPYGDRTIYWVYGDQEGPSAMGEADQVYVDRQGTDSVYSSLVLIGDGDTYRVEMDIYRLGYFQGTAVMEEGNLVFTDDETELKGILQWDGVQAIFEVTQSSSNLAEVGTTWTFPERLDG